MQIEYIRKLSKRISASSPKVVKILIKEKLCTHADSHLLPINKHVATWKPVCKFYVKFLAIIFFICRDLLTTVSETLVLILLLSNKKTVNYSPNSIKTILCLLFWKNLIQSRSGHPRNFKLWLIKQIDRTICRRSY